MTSDNYDCHVKPLNAKSYKVMQKGSEIEVARADILGMPWTNHLSFKCCKKERVVVKNFDVHCAAGHDLNVIPMSPQTEARFDDERNTKFALHGANLKLLEQEKAIKVDVNTEIDATYKVDIQSIIAEGKQKQAIKRAELKATYPLAVVPGEVGKNFITIAKVAATREKAPESGNRFKESPTPTPAVQLQALSEQESLLDTFSKSISGGATTARKPKSQKTSHFQRPTYAEWRRVVTGSDGSHLSPRRHAFVPGPAKPPAAAAKQLKVDHPHDYEAHVTAPKVSHRAPGPVQNEATGAVLMGSSDVPHPAQNKERDALVMQEASLKLDRADPATKPVKTQAWLSQHSRDVEIMNVQVGIKVPDVQGPEVPPMLKPARNTAFKKAHHEWATHVPVCASCHLACKTRLVPGATLLDVSVTAPHQKSFPSMAEIPGLMGLLANGTYKVTTSGFADVLAPAQLSVDDPITGIRGLMPQKASGSREESLKEIINHASPKTVDDLMAMLGTNVAETMVLRAKVLAGTVNITSVEATHVGESVVITATLYGERTLTINHRKFIEITPELAGKLCGFENTQLIGRSLHVVGQVHAPLRGSISLDVHHKGVENYAISGRFVGSGGTDFDGVAMLSMQSMNVSAECGRTSSGFITHMWCDRVLKLHGYSGTLKTEDFTSDVRHAIVYYHPAGGVSAVIRGETNIAGGTQLTTTNIRYKISEGVATNLALQSSAITTIQVQTKLRLAEVVSIRTATRERAALLPTLLVAPDGIMTGSVTMVSTSGRPTEIKIRNVMCEAALMSQRQKVNAICQGNLYRSGRWDVNLESPGGIHVTAGPASFTATNTIMKLASVDERGLQPDVQGSGSMKLFGNGILNVTYRGIFAKDNPAGLSLLIHGEGEVDGRHVEVVATADAAGQLLIGVQFKGAIALRSLPLASGVGGVYDMPTLEAGAVVGIVQTKTTGAKLLAQAHGLIDRFNRDHKLKGSPIQTSAVTHDILYMFSRLTEVNHAVTGVIFNANVDATGLFVGTLKPVAAFMPPSYAAVRLAHKTSAHYLAKAGISGFLNPAANEGHVHLSTRGRASFWADSIGTLKAESLEVGFDLGGGGLKQISLQGKAFAKFTQLRQATVNKGVDVEMNLAGSVNKAGELQIQASGEHMFDGAKTTLLLKLRKPAMGPVKASLFLRAARISLANIARVPDEVSVRYLEDATVLYTNHDMRFGSGPIRAGMTVTGRIAGDGNCGDCDKLLGPLRKTFSLNKFGATLNAWFPISRQATDQATDFAIHTVVNADMTKRICLPYGGHVERTPGCAGNIAVVELNKVTGRTWSVEGTLHRTFHVGGGKVKTSAVDGKLQQADLRFLPTGWMLKGLLAIGKKSVPFQMQSSDMSDDGAAKLPEFERLTEAVSEIKSLGTVKAEAGSTEKQIRGTRLGVKQKQELAACRDAIAKANGAKDFVKHDEEQTKALALNVASNCLESEEGPGDMSLIQLMHAVENKSLPAHPTAPAIPTPTSAIPEMEGSPSPLPSSLKGHVPTKVYAEGDLVTTGPDGKLGRLSKDTDDFFGKDDNVGKMDPTKMKVKVPEAGAEAVFIKIGPVTQMPDLKVPDEVLGNMELTEITAFITNAPHVLTDAEINAMGMRDAGVREGVTIIATGAMNRATSNKRHRLHDLINRKPFQTPLEDTGRNMTDVLEKATGRVALRFSPEGTRVDIMLPQGVQTFSNKDVSQTIGTIDMVDAKICANLPKAGEPTAFMAGTLRLHDGALGERVLFPNSKIDLMRHGEYKLTAVSMASEGMVGLDGPTGPVEDRNAQAAFPNGQNLASSDNDTLVTKLQEKKRETDALLKDREQKRAEARRAAPRSIVLVAHMPPAPEDMSSTVSAPTHSLEALLHMAIRNQQGVDAMIENQLSGLGQTHAGRELVQAFSRLTTLPGVHQPYDDRTRMTLDKGNGVTFTAVVLGNVKRQKAMEVQIADWKVHATIEGVSVKAKVPFSRAMNTLGLPLNVGNHRVPAELYASWDTLVAADRYDGVSRKDAPAAPSLSLQEDGLGIRGFPRTFGKELTVRNLAMRISMSKIQHDTIDMSMDAELVTSVESDMIYQPYLFTENGKVMDAQPKSQLINLKGTVSQEDMSMLRMEATAKGDKPGAWSNGAFGQPMSVEGVKMNFQMDPALTNSCSEGSGECGVRSIEVQGWATYTANEKKIHSKLHGTIDVVSSKKTKLVLGSGDFEFRMETELPKPWQRLYRAFPVSSDVAQQEQKAVVQKHLFEPAAVRKTIDVLQQFGVNLRSHEPFTITKIVPVNMETRSRATEYRKNRPYQVKTTIDYFGEPYTTTMSFKASDLSGAVNGSYTLMQTEEPAAFDDQDVLHTAKGYSVASAQKHCDSLANCKAFSMSDLGVATFSSLLAARPEVSAGALRAKAYTIAVRHSEQSQLLSGDAMSNLVKSGFDEMLPKIMHEAFADYGKLFGIETRGEIVGEGVNASLQITMAFTEKGLPPVNKLIADAHMKVIAHTAIQHRRNVPWAEELEWGYRSDEVTNATTLEEAVHDGMKVAVRKLTDYVAKADTEVAELVADTEITNGVQGVKPVPPANDFQAIAEEVIVEQISDRSRVAPANMTAEMSATVKHKLDKSVASFEKQSMAILKHSRSQLLAEANQSIAVLKKVSGALYKRQPKFKSLELSPIHLGCLYDPKNCDISVMPARPKLKVCFTEIGCTGMRPFPGLTGINDFIENTARGLGITKVYSLMNLKKVVVQTVLPPDGLKVATENKTYYVPSSAKTSQLAAIAAEAPEESAKPASDDDSVYSRTSPKAAEVKALSGLDGVTRAMAKVQIKKHQNEEAKVGAEEAGQKGNDGGMPPKGIFG